MTAEERAIRRHGEQRAKRATERAKRESEELIEAARVARSEADAVLKAVFQARAPRMVADLEKMMVELRGREIGERALSRALKQNV